MHILLLDAGQLHLINIGTMNIESCFLSEENMDIQEIVWSSQLNRFLILTTDRLYQTDVDQIQLKLIHQIQVRDSPLADIGQSIDYLLSVGLDRQCVSDKIEHVDRFRRHDVDHRFHISVNGEPADV
jgi:hypothetical protein